ncbi:hypothetical protein ISCGN_024306 [Ixodes scapularis]
MKPLKQCQGRDPGAHLAQLSKSSDLKRTKLHFDEVHSLSKQRAKIHRFSSSVALGNQKEPFKSSRHCKVQDVIHRGATVNEAGLKGFRSRSRCKVPPWSRQRRTLLFTQTAQRLGSSFRCGPSAAHQGLAFTLLSLNLPDEASTVLQRAQLTHHAPRPLLEFCLARPSGRTTDSDELIAWYVVCSSGQSGPCRLAGPRYLGLANFAFSSLT